MCCRAKYLFFHKGFLYCLFCVRACVSLCACVRFVNAPANTFTLLGESCTLRSAAARQQRLRMLVVVRGSKHWCKQGIQGSTERLTRFSLFLCFFFQTCVCDQWFLGPKFSRLSILSQCCWNVLKVLSEQNYLYTHWNPLTKFYFENSNKRTSTTLKQPWQ